MLDRFKQEALVGVVAITAALGSAIASPAGFAERPPRNFKHVDQTCESGCIDFFESPDGKEVSFTGACYTATAADARAEVRRTLSEGTVLRSSRRIGKNRRSERWVMLDSEVGGKRLARIIWYRAGDICFSFIEAESLELALEFERSKAAVEYLAPYTRRFRG
nr:Unknown Function [uncultured bacterium]